MPAIAVVFCALVFLVVAPPRVEADRPEPIGSNDDGGPFPIGAQAIDRFNTSFAAATPTTDSERPKVTLTGAPTAEVGRPYLLQIDLADPDRHDIRSWVINWGDGNVTTGSGMPETQSHTYTTLGLTYGITVQVVDDEGTWTSSELVTANADGIGGGLGIGAGPGVGVGVEGGAGAEVVVGRYDPITGQATTGFPTTNETLGSPASIAVGPDGLIYVSGRSSSNVVRLNPDNPSLAETFVTAQSGGLRSPNGLTFGPDGHLYVASAGSGQVLRYDGQTGAFVDVVVDSDTLNRPVALLFTSDGSLLVADKNDDNIKRYSAPYVPVSDTVPEAVSEAVSDTVPEAVPDPDTGTVPDGVFAATGAGSEPSALLAGPNGNVLVALSGEQTIAELDATSGALVRTLTSPDPGNPTSLAIGPDGHLWVSYYWQDEVRRFDLVTGQAIETLVSQTSPFEPAGLAFEPAGLAFGPTGLAFTPDLLVTVGDPDGEVSDEPFEPGTRTDVWLDSIQDPSEGVDFVANDGAADSQVDFAIVTESYDAVIGNGEVALVAEGESVADAVIMEVVGSASDAKSRLLDESPILSDTDPAADEDDAIEFEEVLDGVDLVYSADGDDVEYSFIIAPGADPDEITLDFDGAEALSIKGNGDLLIEAETGPSYISTAPVTYQVVDGERVVIASAYDIRADGTVGFTLGAYDLALPVIIDPTFVAVETAGGSYPSGSTIDLPVPAAVTPGDFMIAHVAYNITGITDHLTPPAGWNTVTEVAGNDLVHGVYWRVATASEPSTYGFALTGGSTETAAGSITHYSGVDTSIPINASATQSNGSGAPVDAPSVTTTVADTTIVALWSVRDDGALTPPIGMDERADANSSSGGSASEETIAAVADAPFSTVGATGVATATVDASGGSIGTLLALAPAAGPAAVVHKGVQSGATVMANGTSSVAATIDGVDTTRSFLTYSIRGNNNAPSDIVVTGELTDSTTLTFERVGTTSDVIIEWSVAEFSAGVTVQRGTASLSSSPTNVSITAVPLGRSFPLIGHRTTGSGFGDDDFVRASLSSNTNLRLDANWFTSNTVPWQVVTYDDATVQSGTVAFGAGDSSRTATITSVDTAKAWLTYSTSSEPGTGSNIGQKLVRGVVTDATTVTFDRSSTGQAMDVQWHLIEFTDSTEVQHANAAFGTSTSVVDVTIGAVDRSRAIAVGGERGFGGRSDYITDDNPGHGWFTTKLTSASNLRVERGATGSSADLGWFAIEWVCADSDGDGVTDCYEDADTDADDDPSTNPGPDTDGDTIANYLDPDDDGDGTPTASENADPNGDGDPSDALDADRDREPDYLDVPTLPTDGTVADEQKISSTAGGLTGPLDDQDDFGAQLSAIGDLDGDGIVDLAVGAEFDDDGGNGRGAIYVLFMNGDGTVKAEQKISDLEGGLSAALVDGDAFGSAVSGLGDLDGDGVEDIVVGARADDDGSGNAGAIYVLFMNPDGTVKAEQKISDTTGGLTTTLGATDFFGASVSGIGDLDADGIVDLAVGARLDDDGGSNRGAVYILFLNPDGTVKAEQKISDTTGGLTTALGDNDAFGSSVSGLGDLDADGIVDLAVGARGDNGTSTDEGSAYVLFLNANGTVKAEQKISNTDGGFTGGLANGDYFGESVSGVGDLDADGVVDLVVGAPGDDGGSTDEGALHVLFLNTDGTVKTQQEISEGTGGLGTTLGIFDAFGYAVAGLGDLDGDGLINLAVGVPDDDDGGAGRGAVYVLDLAALVDHCAIDSDSDGLWDCEEDANTDADDDPATSPGPDTDGDTTPNYLDADDDGDGTLTSAAAEAADPDGDGDPRDALDSDHDGQPDYLDLPTGASDATVIAEQKISDTQGGFTATLAFNANFATSLASIGDIDGDGVNDLAVGAIGDNTGGAAAGAVYILFLNTDGTVRADQKITESQGGFTTALDSSDSFGASIAGIGDLDGDGINDIAVGAPRDDGPGASDRGAIYVLLLNADGTVKAEQKISDSEGGFTTTLDGSDKFGASLTALGDLDGDGINDIAVGAPEDDDGTTNAGSVYVLFMNADGTVKSEQKISDTQGGFTTTLDGSDDFGSSITALGDLDGDGINDIAVGAREDDDGAFDGGAVYILLLNANGTVKAEQKVTEAVGGFTAVIDTRDYFGASLTGIGDLDGDGTSDLVVGAPEDDDGSIFNVNRGAVYILFLNPDGTVDSHQKISDTEGNLTTALGDSDFFGSSVAGIGDRNGDGAIDLAVGAPDDDDGDLGHGGLYILDLAPLSSVVQANPDTASTFRNQTTFVDASANDNDTDGDPITEVDASTPTNGTAAVNGAGTVSYTPATNYTGPDSFEYWAIDSGSGLTHYWGLAGDGLDAVGGTDGTLTGATTIVGDFGEALSFDEVDDRVAIPDFAYGADFTLSFDFKLDDNTGSLVQYVYSHGDINSASSSVNVYFVENAHPTDPDVIRTVVRDANDTLDNVALEHNIAGLVGDGLWHTYTLTTSTSNGLTVYLDGVEIASDSTRGTDGVNPIGSAYFGSRHDMDADRFYGGGVDSVQVYARALASAEVADLADGINRSTVTLTVAPCPDSDSDGLEDCEEDANTDADGDPSTNPGPDTDGDTVPNYLDADDDGDGTPTASENADPNGDGDPRDAKDADRDGEPDYLDAPITVATDGYITTVAKISAASGGLTGPGASDYFGFSVASIGDLDRDGIEDLVVGATGDDDGAGGAGAVFVLFMNTDGTVRASQKISSTVGGFTEPLTISDNFGIEVAGIGDIDGDGTPDIAVGAIGDDGGSNKGEVHVIFLNTDGTVKSSQKISETDGGGVPLDTSDQFTIVTGIGDLDGDGINDLAVGAPYDDDGGDSTGAVYILFLNADGTVKSSQKISNLSGSYPGTIDTGTLFGRDLAALGDVDGDGIQDLAVGAPNADVETSNEGFVEILFLNTDGTVRAKQRISDIEGGYNAELASSDYFGNGVGAVGDLDLNGVPDLVVSASGDDDGGSGSGAVSVLFLNVDGTVAKERRLSDLYGGLEGQLENSDAFGIGLTGIGDLNGDGTIDLAAGSPDHTDGGISSGAVRILFSRADPPTVTVQVNSTADDGDANPGDDVCQTATPGVCTLRAAIEEANASQAVDIIEFAIPQSDPNYLASPQSFTITPGTPFDPIIDTVTIDGRTQTEYSGGLPVIVIDGSSAGTASVAGLDLDPGSDASAIHALTIHSFDDFGIEATDVAHVTITDSVFGLEADGVTAAGMNYGLYTDGVGYLTLTDNILSANGYGAALYNDSSNATITGNLVGTDHTGLLDRGNTNDGLFIVNGSARAQIGGSGIGQANVLSGNGDAGVYFASTGTNDNMVEANLIGVGLDGTTPIANGTGVETISGLRLSVIDNVIGPQTGSGIGASNSDGMTIRGNSIGTDQTGTEIWTIGGDGISLGSGIDDVVIGGTGAGEQNLIRNATGAGISIDSAAGSGHSILGNNISGNGGLAIDLGGDGVTLNDVGDADAGPNDLLNTPVITAVNEFSGIVTIDFELDVPAGNYRIEAFQLVAVDPSGYGEADTFRSGATITHTGSGVEAFSTIYSPGTSADLVALSATEDLGGGTYGSTSELSLNPNCPDDDGDGLCNKSEDANLDGDLMPGTNPGPDTDGDTTPNYLDADDDGDGTPTASENADPNGDADPRDALDSDRDGQPDYLDEPTVAATGTVADEQKISDTVGGLTASLADSDTFGSSVASIGDIDGDGVTDVAVGAPADDDGGTDRGAVYVLFLNADGTVKVEQKISDTVGGLAASLVDLDSFGSSVGSIGDLDGDGVNDVVVGAPADDDGGTDRGAVYVLFLNADGTVKAEQKISDTAGGLAAALADADVFGTSAGGLGDVDGDGINDVVIGATGDDGTGTDRGAVYVLFLNADGTVKAEQKIAKDQGGLVATIDDSDDFGISANGLGDLDGDGVEDLAVGASRDDDGGPGRGAVYVLFLNADGTVKDEQKISDVAGGFTATLNNSDFFGASVTGLGDLDSDGIVDLAVGAQADDDGGSGRGAVYVVFLNSNGTVKSEQKISDTEGGLTTTLNDNDWFGVAVAGLGDLDGDGAVGLAVGADGDDDGGSARGAVHIIDLTIETTATVNSTGDSGDANPGDLRCDTGGTNAEGATECTLRAAIEETNAASAKDTINFDIPLSDTGHSAGIWTISPASAQLDGVTANIDGTTQAGWSSTPVIVLDGSLRSGSSTDDGLAVAADGVTISALSIVNWPDDGTHSSYSGATFANLWLGVLPDGTTAANQSSDLVLSGAAANTTVDATVMAAAGSDYGLIVNNTTTGTVVNDSWFGTTPTFANLGAAAEGVVVYGSSDLTVTGSTFGFFPNAPIMPSTSGTVTITGSALGTDLTGAQVLPITEALWSDGSGTIVFGGTGVGDSNIVRNVLNDGFDLAPSFSGTATILGNSIVGTGGLAIDLGADGVTANDPGDADTGANGLANFPEITNATELAGTVTVTFDLDVPVNGDGYRVEFFSNPSGAGVTGYGESEIYLGSTDVAGAGSGYTFNYSGAVGDIITATATQIVGAEFGPTSELSFAMAVNNGTVTVNSTGDGTDAMPGNGLCDTGSTNADGDPECTLRAAITETNASAPLESIVFDIPTGDGGWNAGPGTWTIRPTSPLPTVTAEVTIDGTTQTGFTSNTAAAPAALDGLPVIELNGAAAGSSAAGLHAQARTTINGLIINRFEVAGVFFDTGSDGSRLLGSFVGTDHTGLVPLQTGSASVAVDITSGGVVIGGTAAADRNLLSGNQTAVQAATTNASALQIEGNLIGLGADGVTEVANLRGVSLDGLVTATVTNNVIAANTTHGLVLQDTTATVTGNRIGVNSGGGAAGNGGAGVLTTNADGSIIGGTTGAELNTIANNGGDGVSITAGTNLTVIGNAIQSNGGLAIDWLDDGVTANDGPDVDGVPNRPTITELNLAGATATAEFELDIAAGDYRVEFFRNTAADAAGSGEAEILVGATTITHTGSGAETFTYPFAATAGDLISATATRDWGAGSFGPTSELAVTVAVNTPPTFDQDFAMLSAAEGEVVAIAAAATDLDGDTMAWSASGLPTGLSINPASGAISGTVSATAGAASPYAVAVTVADGRGGTDTDTFSWTVTDTNRAPNLSPIADITADELTTITFTAAATDPDLPADTIVYSATNLPSGATINPTTGEFSWTPTEAQGPGSYTITVTATDNGTPSLEDDQTFTITVDEVNTDPVLSALADQVVGEGSTVSVTPSVSDPDLPANTLSWTATGLPPGLTISSTSGVISGTVSPTAGAGSPYASTVSVDDNTGGAGSGGGGGGGGTDSISFTWTVVDTNRNPVLSTMTDVTVTEGDLASFGASATDPDLPADDLTLSATGLPPGASFDPNTGIFSWPTVETDGPSVVVVTVTVTDDGSPPLDASQPVAITVTEQNQAPSIDPLAIVSGDEGSLIAFTPTATDPDVPVNTLTWSATGMPPGASIDPATGEFSWTPTEAQGPDLYTFTITVTDDGSPALFDSQPVTVEVAETNLAPSLSVVADQNSSEADEITLAPVATDADVPVNTLTWSASGLPPGLFIDPTSGLIAGTLGFDAADNSPHLVTIEVTDEGGATATRSFSWTVAPLNREPTVTIDEAQYQVDEGDRLTITAVAEDPDLDPLTFSLVDPPFGVAIDPGSGVIDWTPDEDQGPATYNFAVAVDDGQATVQTSLTIVVGEVNRPPSVGSPPDQMAIAGKPFTVGLSAADPDLPSNALSFTIIEAPSGMSIDPSSGLLSWTSDPEFSGSVDVEIEVADDGEPALRARTRFTIEVILGKLDVVDTPPVATGDTLYTGYKQTVEVDVLANDLGDDLTLLDVGQVVGGTVEIVGNSIVFAPKEGFAGVATFTYRARQARGGITSATVTVVVAPPELSPIDDVAIAMSGRPIDIEVLANDQFVGQVQTIEVAQPSTGATSVLADRRIRYLPPDTFVGFAGFSYTVADSFGTTRSARVTVSVIEPALPDTTATLTDVDVPETEVAAVAPTTFGFADLSQALINAVATLSIPFRLVVVAGAWATLLVVGLAWIGSRWSVGAITNTARGEHVPVEDPKTGRRVFQFHSGADLIWMGRRRWRRGSWYRKVETPLGSGLVEDQQLCDMNETYLEPELGNDQQ